MKMQKMDPKQAQQAGLLGVLCAVVFGYGIFSALSGAKPAPAEKKPAEGGKAAGEKKGAAADVAEALPPLAPVFTPDPFKPKAVKESGPTSPVAPAPVPAPAPAPSKGDKGIPPFKGGLPAPAVDPTLDRPRFRLAGILDMHEGADMALLDMGTTRRILFVGDEVANSYRIRRIGPDRITLARGKDRFTVLVGKAYVGSETTAPAPLRS